MGGEDALEEIEEFLNSKTDEDSVLFEKEEAKFERIRSEMMAYVCEIVNQRYGGSGLQDAVAIWEKYKDEVLSKI